MSDRHNKKRKYYRKCGICGKLCEQSAMVRVFASPTGWLCFDCHMKNLNDFVFDTEWEEDE